MKNLYRSETNKTVFGVIGGIAEYFGIDPTLLRIVWLVVVVFTGFFQGLLVYIIATLVAPKRSARAAL